MPLGRRGAPSDGLAGMSGKIARRAAAVPDMVLQVVSEDPARVRQAVWKSRRRRVEEDAHRLERLRAQNHHAAVDFARLRADAVDVEDAASHGARRDT